MQNREAVIESVDKTSSMLKFVHSRSYLFIVVTAGLLSFIVLWRCSDSNKRLRDEAEKNLLSFALYAAVRSGIYKSGVVCKVAVAFAEAGDFNRAQLIINDVEETAYFTFAHGRRFYFYEQLDFNMKDKAKALVEVAGVYARNGRKDQALESLSRSLQIVERIEKFYILEPLLEISSKYAELGEDSQALKVIESFKPKRNIDEPESLASDRHWLLLGLAKKYLEAGKSDRAFGILERALQTIDLIKDPSLKSAAFATTGTVYAKAGQSNKAKELLTEALGVITKSGSRSESDKTMALILVAEEYAKSGFCLEAYKVANTITVENNKNSVLSQVTDICSKDSYSETFTYTPPEIEAAFKLIETGERENGMRAIQNFGRQEMSSGYLFDAAVRLAQDGKYDLALEVTSAIINDELITDHGPYVKSQENRGRALAEIAMLYARNGPKEEEERRKFLRQARTIIE